MKDNKRHCFKCKSASTDPDVVLYRFPRPGIKNVQRCELWAKYIFPNGPWSSTTFQKKLYSEHRMLCHKHFKPTSFIDYGLKKLHKHAAPHEECDEVQTENIGVPGPSCSISMDITNTQEPQHIKSSKLTQVQTENIGIPGPSCSILMDITNTQEPQNSKSTQVQTENIVITGPSCSNSMDITNTQEPQHIKSSKLTQVQTENIGIPGPSRTTNIQGSPHIVTSSNLTRTRTPMSPKTKHYYMKCRKALKKICRLQNTIKHLKKKDILHIVSEDNIVNDLRNKISPTFALLLQSQIRNYSRKSKGRRWSTDDKIIALRLFRRSPTSYRLLRRLFCLPAPSSLKKLLGVFSMPPGINKKVLSILKKITELQKPSDQELIIMFDEMSIRKHLQYNKKNDEIEGFQDHGTHGRTSQEAVKALVFMVAGIRKPVKQPLAYFLSGANVTADRLTVLIKETLRQCFNAGLKVSATVCDMGGTNRRAMASLGATADRPIINVDGREVVVLFDAPHLLKCFRNMFLKYDIKCTTEISSSGQSGEGLAKWSYIKDFYEVDSSNPNFVYAPSLKKEHLEPNAKQKMKVNLAAQVFSHTVAAGMFSKVSEGKLPASAVLTATVLSKMDKLFDLVNSDSPDRRRGKPHSTNMSKTSPHASYFKEMRKFFRSIKFMGCPRQPPSLEGWIWTINGLETLWIKMKTYPDVQSLATRRLQQDPLENLFGCIRGNCGSNVNPTTSAFIGGLKTSIMSNLAHISSGNCETDSNQAIINNFKTLFVTPTYTCTEDSGSPLLPQFQSSFIEESFEGRILENSGELQACAYVCGFLIKNYKNSKCMQCLKILKSDQSGLIHNFIENKEYYSKQCLNYATNEFIQCVENCAKVINRTLNEDASKKKLKEYITNCLQNDLFVFLKPCSIHYDENVKYIKCSVFYICVKRFCTLKNRKYAEEASKTALRKKIDILKNH